MSHIAEDGEESDTMLSVASLNIDAFPAAAASAVAPQDSGLFAGLTLVCHVLPRNLLVLLPQLPQG